jgi:hypothetical protein
MAVDCMIMIRWFLTGVEWKVLEIGDKNRIVTDIMQLSSATVVSKTIWASNLKYTIVLVEFIG